MSRKNRNPAAPRIRGSIGFVQKTLNKLIEDATEQTGVSYFREAIKYIIASRMNDDAKSIVNISGEQKKFLRKQLPNDRKTAFIMCTIDYYEKTRPLRPYIKVCLDRNKIYRSSDVEKNVKHAREDCKLCIKRYIKKVEDRTQDRDDHIEENIKEVCEEIQKAGDFFVYFISEMSIGEIPRRLNVEMYNEIANTVGEIDKYYKFSQSQNDYERIEKEAVYYKNVDYKVAYTILCKNYWA